MLPDCRLILLKSWYGPGKGGTHFKHSKVGDEGHDGGGGTASGVTSSAQIRTIEEARTYYKQRFGGRVFDLTVSSGGREIPIRVRFDADHPDAFTDSHDEHGNKLAVRRFSLKRAVAMDRIFPTIQHPAKRLRNHGADLLLERLIDGEHFTVVLTWKGAAGVYEYNSSHFKPLREVNWLQQHQDARKNSGPLQKSEPLVHRTRPSAITAPYRAGNDYPAGSQPVPNHEVRSSVRARDCTDILPPLDAIIKAYPALDACWSIDLWDIDDPGIDGVLKSLGPGERWITVHPNGDGTTGVPVLIQEHPDGSASVIGGAGGKLNHLKLKGVQPKAAYADTLREQHKARTAAQKAATQRDKDLGVYQAKQDARAALRAQMVAHRAEFVKAVAALAGWDEKAVAFDEQAHEGLSELARAKARIGHERDLFRRAKQVVDVNRQRLVADADAREASGLGKVQLDSPDPDKLAAADLDPMPEKAAGLGFDPDYKGRAEAAGLTQADLEHEATALENAGKPPEQIAEEQAKAAEQVQQHEAIAAELKAFQDANPETPKPAPHLVEDAQKAANLVRALKKLRLAEQKARAASAELAGEQPVEPKAFILEVSPAEVESAAAKQVEDDVRTAGARAFLSEVGSMGGEESLGGHVGAGAFNALNAAAQTLGGSALIDRSVVDVLGVAGAAAVLARRFRKDLSGEEGDRAQHALEDFHLAHHAEVQKTTLAEAGKLHAAAKAIELPDAENGADLVVAQELNDKRRQCVTQAQRLVGHALGEMQAGAALVAAMQGKPAEQFEVALGTRTAESAITQLRALGLKQGDYKVERAGGNLVASINAKGLDRLAKPFDVEGMRQIRRNLDIIEGQYDEAGWLPQGFANRPDLAMKVEPGVAPRLALPFAPEGGKVESAVRDYIGGRTADGDPPVDILADLLSESFAKKAGGDPDAYRKVVDKVAPLYQGVDGLAAPFQAMADAFVQKHHGVARTPLHKQDFPVDEVAVDALHRALSALPEGVEAMKPVAELTASDRHALRRWWYANVAQDDPAVLKAREALHDHEAKQPTQKVNDPFGAEGDNPEWHEWKAKHDELAQAVAGAPSWAKYVAHMGSAEAAIAATQDLVRSRLSEGFQGHYNRLRPDSPLMLGKTSIRGGLDHLDMMDPGAREARQAQLAGLQGGVLAADGPPPDSLQHHALAGDERHTLGHAAEQKLAGMMSVVGRNFKAGQPTALWQPSMSGGKNAARQRLIKLLTANKRVMAAFGTGSGKSALQLGGFTHLHAMGKVKKGVIIAPSIVVGQFNGEALRYLKPGQYKWHADPGATREQRLAAYKDPGTHFSVVTHQAFRDDMIHLGAQHAGVTPQEMAEKVAGMGDEERAAWSKSIMEKEGFAFDYMTTDESQYTLNREGKQDSRLANVVDAFSRHAEYYMPSSGDPVKNDACLHPSTIINDPIRGVSATVAEWADAEVMPFVLALDVRDGSVHYALASVPFVKARNRPMFTVVLANGSRVTVAADHRFLTPSGWSHLSDLTDGAMVAVSPALLPIRDASPPVSTSTPRDDGACGHHLIDAVRDWKGRCSTCCRLGDAQLRPAQAHDREALPSLAGAHESCRESSRLGARVPSPKHNHPAIVAGHPSIAGVSLPDVSLAASHGADSAQCRAECSNCGQCRSSRQVHYPSIQACDPRGTNARCPGDGSQADPKSPASPWLFRRASTILFNRIVAIVPDKPADIYDLSVPGFENYWAHGMWHHNSEVFDVMRKMDPARYKDRAAFMRSYGGDTVASQSALKREMARYFYPSRIDPDVQADRQVKTLPLSGEQQAAMTGLQRNLAKMRVARMGDKVDVAAAKAVSPSSFKDVPEAQHEAVAKSLQEALGIVKNAAVRRVINTHPSSAKLDAVVEHANARKGKPGVVFAHNHETVEALRQRLEAAGHRVVTLTGLDSTEEKDAKRRVFQPEAGSPGADILIASDAGATGQNLQRGQWLVQYDTPDTAMVHGQRQGRIFRTGQKNNVELTDLVADHPSEHKARERLLKKYSLRELMTSSLEGLDDTGLAYYLKQRQVQHDMESGATV